MDESWLQALIANWGPMIVLMVVWMLYMSRYLSRTRNIQTRQQQHMERLESLLERIAVSLERRGS